MPNASHVFVVFYAVLYGALFTISDRWRPFFVEHGSAQGILRWLWAAFCYGALPIGYFLAVRYWFRTTRTDTISLLAAAYLMFPLVAFHTLWSWVVGANPDRFYSATERAKEPVRTSLELVSGQLDLWHVALVVVTCLILPILVLVWPEWRE
jgi:hypothetical protein